MSCNKKELTSTEVLPRKPKTLTNAQVVVLLEGDVSEAEVEKSDEEPDIRDVSETLMSPVIPIIPGLDTDMFEVEEEEVDDDVPLAQLVQSNGSENAAMQDVPREPTRHLRWRMTDIEEVDTSCNVSFSDPPEEEMTLYQYFKTMCEDDVIMNFVEQSNLYCVQKTGSSLDTNINEIQQFLVIHLMAGIVKMPSYTMYWADATRFSPIADVMARNRFDKLRTCFHVNDNSNMKARDDPNYDKLFKVRPFIDSVKASFLETEPEEYNSVDELIIPFKGRSSLKQYVKNKPHKWGIKVFARAGTSGNVYDFEIYRGKGMVKI